MELLLIETGQLFQIEKEEITIGRSPDCDFFIPGKAISRVHATLSLSDGKIIVNDGALEPEKFSANGLAINGKILTPGASQIIKNGDEITLAPGYTLKFFTLIKNEEDSDATMF